MTRPFTDPASWLTPDEPEAEITRERFGYHVRVAYRGTITERWAWTLTGALRKARRELAARPAEA